MNVINGLFPAPSPKSGATLPAWVDNLPAEAAKEIALKRVLSTAEAAEFAGYSLGHFRRLIAAGKTPAPVRLGLRKMGFRLGDLIEHQRRSIAAGTAA